MSHVEGPWKLDVYQSDPGGKHSQTCARLIAEGPPWTALADLGFYVEDYEVATANLIAAAPCLLEALNALRTGAGPAEGGGSAPCWCSVPWKVLNTAHSRACQLARAAVGKAVRS